MVTYSTNCGMTSPRRRVSDLLPPRLMTEKEVADYLGMGESHYTVKKEELERHGLPKAIPFLGRRDRHAIDRWLDSLDPRLQAALEPANSLDEKFGS